MTKLRAPLETGMTYLRENAGPTGCASLRYQQTCNSTGATEAEAHALGYFLSLSHLEAWAEQHPSHHTIFSAPTARYKKYGKANQLRTWHEVYVLPAEGQFFEYVNCAPQTGILHISMVSARANDGAITIYLERSGDRRSLHRYVIKNDCVVRN